MRACVRVCVRACVRAGVCVWAHYLQVPVVFNIAKVGPLTCTLCTIF